MVLNSLLRVSAAFSQRCVSQIRAVFHKARLVKFLSLIVLILALCPYKVVSAETTELKIMTTQGTVPLMVEVMKTPQEREQGLMYRRFLADDRGMIFEFAEAAPVYMWMKNTYIPLDMIFVDAHGVVLSIALNTEPLSETIIPSRGAAKAVIEVNAGYVAKHGIKLGDKVMLPFFANP